MLFYFKKLLCVVALLLTLFVFSINAYSLQDNKIENENNISYIHQTESMETTSLNQQTSENNEREIKVTVPRIIASLSVTLLFVASQIIIYKNSAEEG